MLYIGDISIWREEVVSIYRREGRVAFSVSSYYEMLQNWMWRVMIRDILLPGHYHILSRRVATTDSALYAQLAYNAVVEWTMNINWDNFKKYHNENEPQSNMLPYQFIYAFYQNWKSLFAVSTLKLVKCYGFFNFSVLRENFELCMCPLALCNASTGAALYRTSPSRSNKQTSSEVHSFHYTCILVYPILIKVQQIGASVFNWHKVFFAFINLLWCHYFLS